MQSITPTTVLHTDTKSILHGFEHGVDGMVGTGKHASVVRRCSSRVHFPLSNGVICESEEREGSSEMTKNDMFRSRWPQQQEEST